MSSLRDSLLDGPSGAVPIPGGRAPVPDAASSGVPLGTSLPMTPRVPYEPIGTPRGDPGADLWEEADDDDEAAAAALVPGSRAHSAALSRLSSHALSDVSIAPTLHGVAFQVLREVKTLVSLGYPLTLSFVLGFCVNLVAIASVGELGGATMSAVVLATSFYSCTGMAVSVGFAGVLETTCGQAYGGRAYTAVGTALQRGILTSALLCLGVFSFWIPAASILRFMGQPADLAQEAARYLHIMMPCLPLQASVSLFSRYLSSQGASRPVAVAPAAAALASPLALTWGVRTWGADGAAVGLVITYAVSAAVMIAVVVARERRMRGDPKKTWAGWTMASLRGWGVYVRLGVPSVLFVLSEWWAFEACTLASGLLPDPRIDLAAIGVCQNLTGIMYMVPLGLAQATSARVAHALGAGRAKAARLSAGCAAGFTIALQASVALLAYRYRHAILATFTNDPDVQRVAGQTFIFVALGFPFDGMNCVSAGALRGAGKQAYGATLYMCAYWLFGLPLGFYLGFARGYGVPGIYGGLTSGTALMAVFNTVLYVLIDWKKEARRISALAAAGRALAERAREDDWLLEDVAEPTADATNGH